MTTTLDIEMILKSLMPKKILIKTNMYLQEEGLTGIFRIRSFGQWLKDEFSTRDFDPEELPEMRESYITL